MYAGLDFGTSNCSIGIWNKNKNKPELIPIDKKDDLPATTTLPSALYTVKSDIDIEPIDENELMRRVNQKMNYQKKNLEKLEAKEKKIFTREDYCSYVKGQMRKEIKEKAREKSESITVDESLYDNEGMFFGIKAIENHIDSTKEGFFIKSPKSFLGSKIGVKNIERFTEITTLMLNCIKNRAEEKIQAEICDIVLGRPVNFTNGQDSEAVNIQAIDILKTARNCSWI